MSLSRLVSVRDHDFATHWLNSRADKVVDALDDREFHIRVYDDDAEIRGDLRLDDESRAGVLGIVALGNLRVTGSVVDTREGWPHCSLSVGGSLTAGGLQVFGAEVRIQADATIDGTLACGLADGFVDVWGTLRAAAVVLEHPRAAPFSLRLCASDYRVDPGYFSHNPVPGMTM